MTFFLYSFFAGFAIWNKYNNKFLYKFAKPVPLLFLIIYSFLKNFTSTFFFLFLIFSLLGDIFLISQNRKPFILGLISFLLAHIFLSIQFLFNGATFEIYPTIFISTISFFYYLFLLKYLGKLKIPVLVYLIAISVMLILSTYFIEVSLPLFIGTVLFYFSDASLAYGKFVKKYKLTDLTSLSAYFIGQYLIVIGIKLLIN